MHLKPAIQSAGVQGSVGAIVASCVLAYQALALEPLDVETAAYALAGAISGLWALYGRLRAGGIAGLV